MFNHYEIQQMMEAKKMELNHQIKEQSSFRQIEKCTERLSLGQLIVKKLRNRRERSQIDCCTDC